MRILANITAALLFTFMLASAPAFAQEDRPDHAQDQSQDKDKNNKETKDNKEAKDKDKTGAKQNDNGRQEEARPEGRENAHPENAKPEATRPQEQTRPEERRNDNMGRQDQSRPEERGGIGHPVANGGRGQRIPDDKFRAHFGREHHFHVQRAEIVNQAQPQFIYGGYAFVLQQPWPAEWAFDDDCYVDYVDGDYYLYDLSHPGIQILVFVIG